MGQSLKDKTVKGVFWSGIDRFSSRGIQFLFSILIARVLTPNEFGTIAILEVFLALSSTIIDSGFGQALIRKQNRTDEDINTVFYFNIVVAIIMYLILWICAPLIASYYKNPLLIKILRVVGFSLVINSFGCIQTALITIEVNFKVFARISIVNAIVSGFVCLILAHKGFGVWALVCQTMISSIIYNFMIWMSSTWRPSLKYSWRSFREMFSYGSRLLVTGIVNSLYRNIYTLVIGRVYKASDLGEFSKASNFANFPANNIAGILGSVTFPVLSKVNEDVSVIKNHYRRLLKVSSFAIFPAMIGLAAVAAPLVNVLMTDKWAGMIPFMQIFCFAYMWQAVETIDGNLIKVLGRTDYILRLETIKKIIGIVALCVTVKMGMMAMCWGCFAVVPTSLVMDAYFTKRLIGYGIWDMVKDIFPIFLLSALMGLIVLSVGSLIPGDMLRLIIGVVLGILVYGGGAYLFKFPELFDFFDMLKIKRTNHE